MVSSPRRVRGIAVVLAALGMLAIAAQPVGAATPKFGSKLSNGLFPSNAYPGRYCDQVIDGGTDSYPCTWILNQAYGGGTATAPSNGTINKIKVIGGAASSFRLVLAQKNAAGQFRVVSRSANINVPTDDCENNGGCTIRKISISPMAVKTGYYVGIQATKASIFRCDSGGSRIYVFTPPLNPGGPYMTPTDSDGCFMLLQVVYAA
jgi:hypothetical protein